MRLLMRRLYFRSPFNAHGRILESSHCTLCSDPDSRTRLSQPSTENESRGPHDPEALHRSLEEGANKQRPTLRRWISVLWRVVGAVARRRMSGPRILLSGLSIRDLHIIDQCLDDVIARQHYKSTCNVALRSTSGSKRATMDIVGG